MTEPAMIAIVNARVWTADPRRPWADALLVSGTQLVLVGSSAEVKKRAGAAARVVDGGGRTVVPPAAGAMLRAGLPADLALLDRDLPRVSAELVRDAGVLLRIAAGVVVYDPHGLAGPSPLHTGA